MQTLSFLNNENQKFLCKMMNEKEDFAVRRVVVNVSFVLLLKYTCPASYVKHTFLSLLDVYKCL